MEKIKSREFKTYVTPKGQGNTNGVHDRILHNRRKINENEQFSDTIQNMKSRDCPRCRWYAEMFEKYGLPKE